MKKHLVVILAIVIVFLITGILFVHIFLNNFLIPRKIKPLLIETIQGFTGKEPTIENIYFSFTKGIIIENLLLSTPFTKLPLKIPWINLKISSLSFLLHKEIVYKLETSPLEALEVSFKSAGTYSLRDNTLLSKLYIYNLPLVLIKYFYPHLPFEVKGGKSDPELNIQMLPTGELNIGATIPVEEMELKKFENSINGSFILSLDIKKKKSKMEIVKAVFQPEEVRVSFGKEKQDIVISEGEAIFEEEKLVLNNLKMSLLDIPYKLSAEVTSILTEPRAVLKLESNKLSLEGRGKFINKEINIEKLSFILPNSNLELKGKIRNLKTGEAELYLRGVLDTDDLAIIPFKPFTQVEKIKLLSLLEIDTHIAGELRNINQLNSLIKIRTPDLTIDKFKLEDVNLRASIERGILNAELKSKAYDGDFIVDMKDLSLKGNFPFVANLILDEVDLEKFNRISLQSERDLKGILHGEFTCRGEAKKIKEINGEGWFEITDGLLWELPVLGKLSKVIEIPGVEKNVFSEAHANFIVKNQAVSTQDLELISKRLTLKTVGSIYLDGRLNLKVRMEIPQEEEVKSADVIDQIQDILLKGAGSIIKEIHISGTVKDPQYKILPSIGNIFQNILP